MGKYLITGRSGSGKSTICEELVTRGFPAFDADKVLRLASWLDAKTMLPMKTKPESPSDYSNALWNWDPRVFHAFLDKHHDLYLCGSADNQLEFHDFFDKVFVLILEPEEQRRRILARTSHNYGKHPDMQARVLKDQQSFSKQAIELGGIAINAMPTSEQIVDEILSYVG